MLPCLPFLLLLLPLLPPDESSFHIAERELVSVVGDEASDLELSVSRFPEADQLEAPPVRVGVPRVHVGQRQSVGAAFRQSKTLKMRGQRWRMG